VLVVKLPILLLAMAWASAGYAAVDGDLPPVDDEEVDAIIDKLPPVPPVAASSPAGFLEGRMSVSDQGDAVYRLTLPVPPGRGGISPTLALDYSSGRGQGLLGRGWMLDVGTSAIARCGRTLAEDGQVRPVRLDDEDRLCLDGERLVLVAGASYWAPGAEYRTRRDRVARIVRLPTGVGGPTFEVWTRDGLIHRYGHTPYCTGCGTVVRGDNQVETAWLLAEVSDRHGNLIEYAYDQDLNQRPEETGGGAETESYRPATIWYSANRTHGVLASRRVDIRYRTRGDAQYGWALGARRSSEHLVDRIEVRAADPLLSATPPLVTLEMTYDSLPPSERYRLASVRACDHAGVCQQPTSFQYQQSIAGFEPGIVIAAPVLSPLPLPFRYDGTVPYVMDVDGDGRHDLVYPRDGAWRVLRADPAFRTPASTGQPFLPEINTGHPTQHEVVRGLPLDFDQDGRDDLLLIEDANMQGHSPATWRLLMSRADGTFDVHDTGTPYPSMGRGQGDPSAYPFEPEPGLLRSLRTHVLDWNGDAYPDLVTFEDGAAPGSHRWHVRLNNGQGGFSTRVYRLENFGATRSTRVAPVPLDIEGDGAGEILVMDTDPWSGAAKAIAFENGSPTIRETYLPKPYDQFERFKPLDVNGDGLLDVIFHSADGFQGAPQINWLFVNTGAAFRGTVPGHGWLPRDGFYGGEDRNLVWSLPHALGVDYDRDGMRDVLMPKLPLFIREEISHWMLLRARRAVNFLTQSGYDGDGDGLPDAYFAIHELPDLPYDPVGVCHGAEYDEYFWLGPQASYPRARVLDFDGDGLEDLVQVECGQFVAYRGAGRPDGLLVSVWEGGAPPVTPTDPANPTYLLHYRSGADPVVYTRGQDCAYPQQCIVPRKSLVELLEIDAGRTSRSRLVHRYRYEDARIDLLGWGGLGFAALEVTELDAASAPATVMRTEFRNHERHAVRGYPLAGLPAKRTTTTFLAGGATLTETEAFDYYVRDTWSGVHIVGPQRVIRDRAEARGGATQQLAHEQTDHDTPSWYGGVRWTETVTSTGTTRIDRELADNPAAWVVAKVAVEDRRDADHQGRSARRMHQRDWDMATGTLRGVTDDAFSAAHRLETSFTRNALGLVERIEQADSAGNVRGADLRYDDQQIFPVYQRNALGHEWAARVDAAWGPPLVVGDANGLVTTRQVDGFGRLAEEQRPDGTTTTYTRTWAPRGADHTWSVRTATPGHGDTTRYYGRRGELVRHAIVGFRDQIAEVAYAYDMERRLVSVSEPYEPGTRASHFTVHVFNNLGRLVRTGFPDGTSRTTEFEGDRAKATDRRGITTVATLDADDRVLGVEDAAGGLTVYRYGPRGVLTDVFDANGNHTEVVLDPLGRRAELRDLDLGTRRWTYDAFGDEAQIWSDEHGWRMLARDALGRVRTITDADGVTTFDYDQGFRGELTGHASPGGVEWRRSFDLVTGRWQQTFLRLPGEPALVISPRYDALGRIEALTYPPANGRDFRVRYGRDGVGNVIEVADDITGRSFWSGQEADLRGALTVEAFGNGLTTTRSYVAATSRLERIRSRRNGAASDDVQDLSYGYDEEGNLRFRFDQMQRAGLGLAEAFTYDGLSRLTDVRLCDTAPPTTNGLAPSGFEDSCPATWQAEYDALDNITSRSDRGAYVYGGRWPHAVTQVGADRFDYDDNGNQIARPDGSLEYTAFDKPRRHLRPSTGEAVQFAYDALGDRIRKTGPALESVYLGALYRRDDVPGAPIGHPNATHRYFVHAGGRPIAEVARVGATGETVSYLHADHLGSTDVRSDGGATGTMVTLERTSYDAFGQSRDPDWLAGSQAGQRPAESVGFTGRELDYELGLVNLGARLYDPSIARFMTPDPLAQAPSFEQGLNRYSYVLNNPLTLVDPSGFQAEFPGGEIIEEVVITAQRPAHEEIVFEEEVITVQRRKDPLAQVDEVADVSAREDGGISPTALPPPDWSKWKEVFPKPRITGGREPPESKLPKPRVFEPKSLVEVIRPHPDPAEQLLDPSEVATEPEPAEEVTERVKRGPGESQVAEEEFGPQKPSIGIRPVPDGLRPDDDPQQRQLLEDLNRLNCAYGMDSCRPEPLWDPWDPAFTPLPGFGHPSALPALARLQAQVRSWFQLRPVLRPVLVP
jgi:RHS repeat-associated protein